MTPTPLVIQIMLACHCSSLPESWFSPETWKSQPAQQARRWLEEQGLIEPGSFLATDKGRAWVGFICATPLPKIEWVLSAQRE